MEFPIQASITHDIELNGNQSVSFSVLPTKVNKPFIDDISEMWEFIDIDEVVHKVIYAKKKGEGNLLNVEIKAIPLFYDTMDNSRIYEEYNEHMPAQRAFTRIFEDMPFGFVLGGQFDAVEWEGFGGGETRLETFKRALERYKAEFKIVGDTVYLEHQIGRDTSFMYRYKLNASNIVKEIDAGGYWTYGVGYGDYGDGDGGEDWESAKLFREYTSPLAKIIGKRHAPPIKNGNITDRTTMYETIKTLVDESLKISITTDIHDLRRQGYALAQPEVGDRVFIMDERIGLDEEVRVIDISVTKDWRGNILDLKLTIGSESLTKRHQSNMSTAVDAITDLIEGRRKLPFNVLDDAVKNATKSLKDAQTELTFSTNGILSRDVNNPNLLTLLNSAGIGISNDGGNTFRNSITGNGVVAETITGQSIIGVSLSSADESGYFHVSGSNAEFYNVTNNRRVNISPDGLYGYNASDSIRFQADASLVTSAALGTSNSNVYLAASDEVTGGGTGEARVVRYSSIPGDGSAADYRYLPIRANAFKSPPTANAYIGTDGEFRVMSEGLTNGGVYRNVRSHKVFADEYEVNEGDILYLRSDDRVRIMKKGNSNSYAGLQVADIQSRSIRFNTEFGGSHFYIGVDEGELRVTTNGLSDGGYRPVRALRYMLYDGTIITGTASLMAMRPNGNEGTSLVKNIDLLRYTENGEAVYRIHGSDIAVDDVVASLVKSNQELDKRLELLEEK